LAAERICIPVRLRDVILVDFADETPAESEIALARPRAVEFDDFFVAHHAEMVRALSLALGDGLGPDAASEGFARALQRWGKVSTYANPEGWVYRVGLNWGRSRWRRRRREVSPFDPDTEGSEPDRLRSVIASSDESAVDLRAALFTLSVDHRAVIVGRYYLDWSERDVAAALEIAEGTVKSRLSRAVAKLAEVLEKPDG
jgi:RNA polymerase sigma-70 factor (ECF subfamily)